MIADKEEIINQLQSNIQNLKSLYEKEKNICNELSMTNSELSKKLNQKDFEIESLEVKLSTLKLAKSLSGNNNDMHDAKIKVTNLVREIDKCIALLNR
jgi:predicted RNase H-like nuclease (RuvC/YqgF family)